MAEAILASNCKIAESSLDTFMRVKEAQVNAALRSNDLLSAVSFVDEMYDALESERTRIMG
mgnify:CR=1 FL=1